MRYGYLVALAVVTGAVLFYLAPPHREAIRGAVQWWDDWSLQAGTNLLPDGRGLNVAVLDARGRFLTHRVFDTYLDPNSGFDRFVGELPAETWVLVAAKDEASQALSPSDVSALRSLGGTDVLAGKFRWAYLLVGRPGLAPGAALELTTPEALDLRLGRGRVIGGAPLPTGLRIRSAGYDTGNHASAHLDFDLDPLWNWIRVALGRA